MPEPETIESKLARYEGALHEIAEDVTLGEAEMAEIAKEALDA